MVAQQILVLWAGGSSPSGTTWEVAQWVEHYMKRFLWKNRTANLFLIALIKQWSQVRVLPSQQNVGVAEVVSCAALIRRRRRFESFHRHKYRKADITFLPYVGRFRLRVYDKTLLYAGLAQLVQSICLTSRGSLVRIHHPAHIWASSSVGRTPALQAGCHGFESHLCPHLGR